MTDMIGGALMAIGGGALSAVAFIGASPRSAIERARELLGDSDEAVVRDLPPAMTTLLDQLD